MAPTAPAMAIEPETPPPAPPAPSVAPSRTLAALKELFVAGLVDMNQLKTSAFLTPEGYEAAQKGEAQR